MWLLIHTGLMVIHAEYIGANETSILVVVTPRIFFQFLYTLQWRHNERDGLSNRQHIECLLNYITGCLGADQRKTSQLRVTCLCEGNPPVTDGLICPPRTHIISTGHYAFQSFAAKFMMTSSNGNIFRVTGPLCGNSPVTGEFPAQRPVTGGLWCFLWFAPE